MALKSELPPSLHHLPLIRYNQIGQTDINIDSGFVILITGTGPQNSKRALDWLFSQHQPLYVLNLGTAASPHYPVGSIIQVGTCYQENRTPISLLPMCPIPLPHHVIKNQSLHSQNHAIHLPWPENINCVDMEAYEQAQHCQENNIAFHCIKIISDPGAPQAFKKALPKIHSQIEDLLSWHQEQILSQNISVIIPTYNRAEHLDHCIQSVLQQDHAPKEIIIIDDGSTDHTHQVLQKYPQVQSHHLSKNKGVSYARNQGVNLANSPWICFLDSDDTWESNKLRNQCMYLSKHPYLCLLQSQEKWIRHQRPFNQKKHHQKKPGWNFEESLSRCMLSTSSICIKKSLLEINPFDETLPTCEDYDLWLKLTRYYPVGLDHTTSLTKYGGHPDQLSEKYTAMDQFRVQSLMNIYQNESNKPLKNKILKIINKKCTILENGYKKRKNTHKEEYYKALVKKINQHDTSTPIATSTSKTQV